MITTKKMARNIDTLTRSEMKKEIEKLRAENKQLRMELKKSKKTTKAARKENYTFYNIFFYTGFVYMVAIFVYGFIKGWNYNYDCWFFNHANVFMIIAAIIWCVPVIVRVLSKDK
jgi:hypothetical protein